MPKPSRSRPRSRRRPLLTTTCAPDVIDALRQRAAAPGESLSSVTEAAFRAGLGLPAAPAAAILTP